VEGSPFGQCLLGVELRCRDVAKAENTAQLEAASRDGDEVLAWRLEQFRTLGFTRADAAKLASSPADLAEARSLVACGCSPELAREILR
jgi:hypothetical protein